MSFQEREEARGDGGRRGWYGAIGGGGAEGEPLAGDGLQTPGLHRRRRGVGGGGRGARRMVVMEGRGGGRAVEWLRREREREREGV